MNDTDTIADLYYLMEYARTLRERIRNGETLQGADIGMANRMKELADKAATAISRKVQQAA